MLLKKTSRGIYCERGDFYIDPWRPVDYAVITHGHSDHARWGSKNYLSSDIGVPILRERIGRAVHIQGMAYGQTIVRNGVNISFHPAGHILGSAQVRVEQGGEVVVVSGDYKIENDGLCQPFESVPCHTFITESTFGLPIYRWIPQANIFSQINDWWRENQASGRTSVLFCYALGKAQRVLSGLDENIGPIFLHGAAQRFVPVYEEAGARFPETRHAEASVIKNSKGKGVVLAPTSADNSPWLKKFGDVSTAFVSGWMQIRGTRRRRSLDRGFVLSDHADWEGLLSAIKATGAESIFATHGYTGPLVRWLNERGWHAEEIETRFQGETEDAAEISLDGETSNARAEIKALELSDLSE